MPINVRKHKLLSSSGKTLIFGIILVIVVVAVILIIVMSKKDDSAGSEGHQCRKLKKDSKGDPKGKPKCDAPLVCDDSTDKCAIPLGALGGQCRHAKGFGVGKVDLCDEKLICDKDSNTCVLGGVTPPT